MTNFYSTDLRSSLWKNHERFGMISGFNGKFFSNSTVRKHCLKYLTKIFGGVVSEMTYNNRQCP